MPGPRRPAAREPVEQEQRPARAAAADLPADAVDVHARSRPDRRRDDRGDLAVELDVAGTIGAQLEHLHAGLAIDRSTSAPQVRGPDQAYSPPNAVTIGPTSIPCGVPKSSS